VKVNVRRVGIDAANYWPEKPARSILAARADSGQAATRVARNCKSNRPMDSMPKLSKVERSVFKRDTVDAHKESWKRRSLSGLEQLLAPLTHWSRHLPHAKCVGDEGTRGLQDDSLSLNPSFLSATVAA
jgi:hypothetical protein